MSIQLPPQVAYLLGLDEIHVNRVLLKEFTRIGCAVSCLPTRIATDVCPSDWVRACTAVRAICDCQKCRTLNNFAALVYITLITLSAGEGGELNVPDGISEFCASVLACDGLPSGFVAGVPHAAGQCRRMEVYEALKKADAYDE